ncbi:MAG: 2-C-methyl-D-erythritol 4-phosphate cytidylyltransferase [Ruminococcaceae bacterium]|nr:2-C-methyl-D-erythritol 4-phosphate cytidylyltransferase [Oscillospiraceae bacterium]
MSVAYKTADLLRAARGKKRPHTSAIIVAAGNSTRMGDGVSKQFLTLGGIPVLARTLLAFEATREIDEVVVVARAEDLSAVSDLATANGITKLAAVVAGGATRAESVKNGFLHVHHLTKFVAIHDGARCLVTPDMIERVLHAARRHKAATAACTVHDTVKVASRRGFIAKTVDRSTVYLATTPQVFSANLYRAALETVKDAALLTDDNQLIEKLPYPVKLVDCGKDNIKITEPRDLRLATLILEEREGKL